MKLGFAAAARLYIASPQATETTMSAPSEFGAMSIETFCEWVGIGRSLAYREIDAGRLKIRKVGRRTLITREAASNWLSSLPEK